MPVKFARRLMGRERTADANRHLGFALTFVAGATNAGGYLAVKQYTSHMTGIVSSMADNLVLGDVDLALGGLGGILSFLCGAASSAVMVNYARRRGLQSEYALPLLLEAALLLCFGLLGARLSRIEGLFVPATVMLLCFIMGLQNAVISKISHAEIRTTHITGMVTDIGIRTGQARLLESPPGARSAGRVVEPGPAWSACPARDVLLRGRRGGCAGVQIHRLLLDRAACADAGHDGRRARDRRRDGAGAATAAPLG